MSKRIVKIVILGVIVLIILSFSSKQVAEDKTVEYLVEVSKSIGVEVEVYKVWSKVVGFGKFEVFVEYKAGGLELVSMFNVQKGQVVSGVRVSP